MALLNIYDSSLIVAVCASPSATNGLADAGWNRACINYCYEWMTSLVEDIFGLVDFLGNKYNVLDILSDVVFGIYDLWQQQYYMYGTM